VNVQEPRIKRYALLPRASENGVRRYALARVATSPPHAERLERMEEVAARDRPVMDFRAPVWEARPAMLTTVAVGTDGSATASKAVEAAVEIAQRFDAKLVLLSAFQGDSRPRGAPSGSEERDWAFDNDARVREMLRRAEQELRERKIDCTTLLDEGDPADVLVKLAEECQADLLVIGNRGMQRRVLGSVPNTVTHRAPCSVYVVKTT
jgi:nucleotide-binding universal stress UspA family protein